MFLIIKQNWETWYYQSNLKSKPITTNLNVSYFKHWQKLNFRSIELYKIKPFFYFILAGFAHSEYLRKSKTLWVCFTGHAKTKHRLRAKWVDFCSMETWHLSKSWAQWSQWKCCFFLFFRARITFCAGSFNTSKNYFESCTSS